MEGALALLLLVTLLACLSRAALSALLRTKAESASFQAALRGGRHLPAADGAVAREMFGAAPTVRTERNQDRAAPLGIELPLSLAGRDRAVVTARTEDGYGERSLAGPLAPEARGASELSCDPWNRRTPTGSRLTNAVRALVATGWLQ